MKHIQLVRPAVGTLLGRLLGCLLLTSLVSGCVSQTVKRVDTTAAHQATEVIPEAMLLDVGIHLFDPNVPEEWRDRERDGILPEVRRAEARYLPFILKDTLEGTGNWGRQTAGVQRRDAAAGSGRGRRHGAALVPARVRLSGQPLCL